MKTPFSKLQRGGLFREGPIGTPMKTPFSKLTNSWIGFWIGLYAYAWELFAATKGNIPEAFHGQRENQFGCQCFAVCKGSSCDFLEIFCVSKWERFEFLTFTKGILSYVS